MQEQIQKIISEFDKEFEIIGEVQFGQSFPCEGGYCGTSVSKIKDFITKAYQSGREDGWHEGYKEGQIDMQDEISELTNNKDATTKHTIS